MPSSTLSQDKDVVFMETAVQLENARTHACIEAVPLPAKAFAKAPLYFKKVVGFCWQSDLLIHPSVHDCLHRGGATAGRGVCESPAVLQEGDILLS